MTLEQPAAYQRIIFFSLSFYYIQFDFSFLKVITFFCHLLVEMDFFFSLYGVRGLIKTEMFNFFNQYCWLKAVSLPFLLEWSSSISWFIFLKPVHSWTAWGLIRFLGILPWVNLKSWYSTPFLTWLQNSSSTHLFFYSMFQTVLPICLSLWEVALSCLCS